MRDLYPDRPGPLERRSFVTAVIAAAVGVFLLGVASDTWLPATAGVLGTGAIIVAGVEQARRFRRREQDDVDEAARR